MKKSIVFDVDGTAIKIGEDFGLPSLRLKAAISALKPHYHVSIATGRSMHYAKHIIDFLELDSPCIVASGTEIFDPKEQSITWRVAIPNSAHQHIINSLKNNKNSAYSDTHYSAGYIGDTVHDLLDDQTSVIYVLEVAPDEADAITSNLRHPELNVINMHAFDDATKRDLHIHSAKASKEHAVKTLQQILGVNQQDTIVIGDGLNDLHLFKAGGTKVAMGNAVIELKNAADKIIGRVDQDGLAEYLETLATKKSK